MSVEHLQRLESSVLLATICVKLVPTTNLLPGDGRMTMETMREDTRKAYEREVKWLTDEINKGWNFYSVFTESNSTELEEAILLKATIRKLEEKRACIRATLLASEMEAFVRKHEHLEPFKGDNNG